MDAIVARALNTALGGAIALTAYWIWPTWEHTQVNTVIADMLTAYRRYLAAIVTGPATAIAAERLPGRLARSNAVASVARLASEPGTRTFLKHQELANCLNSILVSSHSFARAAMALESSLGSTRPAALKQFGRDADVTLGALAEAVRNSTAPPRDLPDLRQAWITMERSEPHTLLTTETDRIATSLNTLREQISQLNRKR